MEDVQVPHLGTFIASCACATLGMMVSLCFIIFHMYHRNNRIVKMTSPYLNLLVSIGAVVLSVSCFMFGLDFLFEENFSGLSSLCQTRVWLIVCAVSMLFGPVVVKSWRVYQIFKYGAVKRVVIKDTRLFLIIACILIIDIIIMCLWQIIDPLLVQHTHYFMERLRPVNISVPGNTSITLQECACQRLPLWISILALWKIVIISQALVLAWKIRNVTVPALNDSLSIMAAVCGTILLSFVGLVSTSSFQNKPNAVYVLTTILIAGCSIWVQLILFIPKIHYWWKNSEEYALRISSASLQGNGTGEIDNVQLASDVNGNSLEDDGIVELVEENKILQQSLLEKQEYIGTLQKHLDIAKEKISHFPGEPNLKEESGMEFDTTVGNDILNESGIYDTLRSPERNEHIDRSVLYRVDGLPTGENTDFESVDESEDQSKHETKLKYCPSIRSWNSRRSFVEEFTDIRNSLAAEISTAQAINNELKDSYDKDFRRSFSETEWLYERTHAEDLATSIRQSYDLDNNKETLLYINSYIPRENNVYQVRSRSRSASVVSINSSETFSQTSIEIESSNAASDVTSVNRQNATPNSQQHAAILRYYSYRHMNDKFNRYIVGRYSKDNRLRDQKVVLNGEVQRNGDLFTDQIRGSKNCSRSNILNDSFV